MGLIYLLPSAACRNIHYYSVVLSIAASLQVAASEDREIFEALQAACRSGDEGVGLTDVSVMQCFLRLLYSSNTE